MKALPARATAWESGGGDGGGGGGSVKAFKAEGVFTLGSEKAFGSFGSNPSAASEPETAPGVLAAAPAVVASGVFGVSPTFVASGATAARADFIPSGTVGFATVAAGLAASAFLSTSLAGVGCFPAIRSNKDALFLAGPSCGPNDPSGRGTLAYFSGSLRGSSAVFWACGGSL